MAFRKDVANYVREAPSPPERMQKPAGCSGGDWRRMGRYATVGVSPWRIGAVQAMMIADESGTVSWFVHTSETDQRKFVTLGERSGAKHRLPTMAAAAKGIVHGRARQSVAARDSCVRLIVSVDTEEDNWPLARKGITVSNIEALPRFQAFMRRLGLKATYLTTYQVASVPWAAAILNGLTESGAAELGAHLHPWNTPPMDEPLTPFNSMTLNLPGALQRRKLEVLTDNHRGAFGTSPISFRTGRYALGRDLLAPLIDLGYRVDSSVTPYYSWESYGSGPSHVDAPVDTYRLGPSALAVSRAVPEGPLQEVPVSCGYSRGPFEFWHSFHTFLHRPLLRRLHAPGVAWRMRVVRRIMLTPEIHSVKDMLALSRQLMGRGLSFLNLTLHSSSLVPGLSAYGRSSSDVARTLTRIEEYVDKLAAIAMIEPATLAEMATSGGSAMRDQRQPR